MDKNIAFAGTTMSTSRTEFIARFDKLKQNGVDLESAIDNDIKKLADWTIYGTKVMGGASSKEIFEPKDTTRDSITNLNGAKLEANQMFLLEKIRLLSATVEADTEANLANADFDIAKSAILNGELEIEVSGKTCLPRTSCRVFDKVAEATDGLAGCYKLANPVIITPQSIINATIRVNSAVASTLNLEAVRLELIGSKVIPA